MAETTPPTEEYRRQLAEQLLENGVNNGVSSEHMACMLDDEGLMAYQEPRSCFWNLIDLVLNLGQIVVAIVLLTHLKGQEDPTLFRWIIVYTCGCIVNLPIICFGLCCEVLSTGNVMYYKLEKLVGQLYVIWSLILFWLSLAFFAFIIIRYGISNIDWIMVCIPLFVMELIVNYLDNLIPLSKGAQILVYIAEFAYPITVLGGWCCRQ